MRPLLPTAATVCDACAVLTLIFAALAVGVACGAIQ